MKKYKVNFKLKEPSASYPSLIYLKSYFNYQRFTYSTGRKIHPQYWHDGIQRPITFRRDLLKNEIKTHLNPTELRKELVLIESLIKQGKADNPIFITEMQNITADLHNIEQELISAAEYYNRRKETITPQILKQWMDESLKPEKAAQMPQSDFYTRFDEFLESRMKSNSILTIKKFRTLKTRLKEFEKRKRYKITFESIDLVFYDRFKNFLLSEGNQRTKEVKGLLNDTLSKYFSSLKTYMQWSLDRGYHTNNIFQHNQFSAKKKSRNEIVTLSEGELMKIYQLDLSENPFQEKIRDLFCFATFTGQRWSDVESFGKEDIKHIQKEDSTETWWIFESRKTKETMKVPFKGFIAPAMDILEKYDFELPSIIQQTFNKEIKKIGEKAKLTEQITLYRYSGNQKIPITKPKHKFISSHMARRSCVTILLQRGMAPTTVMKLTGHKDLKTLMRYENTSEEALSLALENI